MPQPFKRRPNQDINIGQDAILARPDFAVLIASVAGYWSRLEHVLGIPFALLLSGKEPTALACYHSVFDLNLRKQMFVSAAAVRDLPNELVEEFGGLHASVRKLAKRRNIVVHGLWGVCEDRKESILLCEANAWSELTFKAQSIHNAKNNKSANSERTVVHLEDFVEYTRNDFRNILNEIANKTNEVQSWVSKIMDFSVSNSK